MTAILKLSKVPARTYSRFCVALYRSIDFAATISPTAGNWPRITRDSARNRSVMPKEKLHISKNRDQEIAHSLSHQR